MPFHVSHSKVKTWRKCRQAYYQKYIRKLRRRVKRRPLQFGSIVHTCLEDYANGGGLAETLARLEKEQGKLFRQEREEYGDILNDVRVILTDYFDFWGEKSLKYVRMRGKSSEFTFEVDIAPGIVLVGKIDNIARTPNDLRWLVEHKSGKNPPTEDHRWRNIQSSIYCKVIELLKLPDIDGTLWDFICSKSPTVPEILKSHKVSTRHISTLPTKIDEWLSEKGLSPKHHVELLAQAEENRPNYFKRVFTPLKPRVVEALWDDFVATAKEMKAQHGNTQEMNIDRHCDWCDYEALCRARLTGGDVKYIEKKDYYVSEKPEDEEPDFEA